jgi:hypothetical protein
VVEKPVAPIPATLANQVLLPDGWHQVDGRGLQLFRGAYLACEKQRLTETEEELDDFYDGIQIGEEFDAFYFRDTQGRAFAGPLASIQAIRLGPQKD